ncbi:adenylate kinase [Streptococcus dentapri]|uniref:Adenylate kinase n=1 Tax=Streptococcus dentapri TaxID=573564 RepID=A0ABV8D1E2_9STRE
MNLLIMGLPGAGKGTQAAKIVEKFDLVHISTGDMFRTAMANQTEMGMLAKSYIDKGELVPDEVTNGIVKERLAQDDIAQKGFLLDGYPRTIEQAHALEKTLAELAIKLDGVVNIDVAPENLVERLSGRFICSTCGATYHKVFNPTKTEGICDVCGGKDFFQREDDKPDTVKRRLDINIAQGEPIIAYYRKQNLVYTIEGNQDIEDVFKDVSQAISSLK